MTADGVIAQPSERTRETGRMYDIDGVEIRFGVSGGIAQVHIETRTAFLDHAGREEFTRRWFQAVLQADASREASDG